MTKIPVLFELMKQRKITATQITKDLGISSGNISDWKSGRAAPSLEKLKALAQYFGVSTDYLLGNETIDQQLEGVDFALHSESEDLTEDQKKSVIKFMKFLKSQDPE